ncbi:hypothetical protein, partial [Bradyrhizobium sp. Leo170]|uniref:hypothetical protein n=1 Tax=Bradyrhizobium sp. Leo170 TaxID=1571199 RepID=UPI001A90F7E4
MQGISAELLRRHSVFATACFASDATTISMLGPRQNDPTGKSLESLSTLAAKNIPLSPSGKS